MTPGSLVADRFEIVARAGSGAMGEVFRALDRATGATVALKVVHRHRDARPERLDREAEALAALAHPGLCGYVARGVTESGRLFLAMEWIDGETLEQRLARGPLSVDETVALGARLGGALAAAHRQGIVHRDVKPSNILLPGGDPAAARLVDFGIASLPAARRLTATGVTIGTPAYMAPEQARAQPVNDRADVFALGAVLFECLAGDPPYKDPDFVVMLLKVATEEAPRLRERCTDAPAALDDLLARLLARAPGSRPAAGEVLAELSAMASRGTASRGAVTVVPAAAASLTRVERRVATILLAAPPAGVSFPEGPLAALDAQGAYVERLEDGSIVALCTSAEADPAARAARGALALRAAVPALTAALSTGRSEVGERWELGALLGRARDELGRAAPGVIAVDEVSAGLLGAGFEVSAGVAGQELSAERDEGAPRTLLGRRTPFLGREVELAQLGAIFTACAATPAARAALVVGAPGVGKSRLREEVVRAARAQRPDVTVWFGRGDPMSAGSAFGLIARALRRAAGIRDGEAEDTRRARFVAWVARCVPAQEAARVAQFAGEACGVPFPDGDAPQLRAARRSAALMGDQVRRALLDLIAAESASKPLLLVLEDLHWGDRPSLDLVSAALSSAPDHPLMVLVLGRPELSLAEGDPFSEGTAAMVKLGPLPERAGRDLVCHALGEGYRERAPALVARAGGNAFYLEELIRAVAEGRGEALPETVLATVEARIGGLDPEERRTLRAASIFGRSFWLGGLTALLDEEGEAVSARLAALSRRELVARRPEARFPGEQEHVFRDALVGDAAYAMLSDQDRASGHARAGAWLEAAGETDARALAGHFDRGGDAARAVRGYRRAATQALEANAFDAVSVCVERALALGASGEERSELLGLDAEARAWSGDDDAGAVRGIEALALLPYGGPAWCRVAGEVVRSRGGRLDLHRFGSIDERVAALRGEGAHQILVMARLAAYHFITGRQAAGEALLDRVEAQASAAGEALLDRVEVRGQVHMARAWRFYGRSALASLEQFQRAAACLEEAGDLRQVCRLRIAVGNGYRDLGAVVEAEAELEEARRTAERLRLDALLYAALQNLGRVRSLRGAHEDAVEVLRRSIAGMHGQGNPRMEGGGHVYLARALAETGDLDGAERSARLAVELLAAARPARTYALAVLGSVLLQRGRAAEALSTAREAKEELDAQGGIPEGGAHVLLTYAGALRGALDPGADDALRAARAYVLGRAAEIGDPARREAYLRDLPDNARTLAVAQARLGDP